MIGHLILLALLSQDPSAPPGAAEAIRFEEASPRGDYLRFWRIEASGRLQYRFVDPDGRSQEGELEAGADGFGRLASLLAPLERPPEPCLQHIGGQAVAQVAWTRAGSTTAFTLDRGCATASAAADAGALRQASDLVRDWIAQAPR